VPIFFQHQINETTRLGIWKIEETEDFFLGTVPLQREVTHPHKRLQHLAGRFLLQFLYPGFPYELIEIADTRKPYLPNEQYQFSISHCADFAAAIVSKNQRVGVDIEVISDRIHRVAYKFLSQSEQNFLNRDDKLFLRQWGIEEKVETEFLTLIWNAKESIFKWYGNGGVDFSQQIQLNGDILFNDQDWITMPFIFSKEKEYTLHVHARLMNQLTLAWVMS
jgi:4'-phosphopantetheinyl transferase EntD